MLKGFYARHKRAAGMILVPALTLLATACLFAPGKFISQLDLRKDGAFSFHYTGEILMVPLMESEKDKTFTPEPCHDDDSFDERPCTSADVARQKAEWEEQRAQKKRSDAQAAQALLGGIDPSDPEAGKAIAQKLSRQAGWNRVDYLGNGRFEVDYAMTGRLDRDFVFPTFEGFAMSNAFVQVIPRKDGTVRLDAPGFGPANSGAGMAGMMSGLSSAGTSASSGEPPSMADGTFTVTSDATILANNTDEGPSPAPNGQSLAWKIDPRTSAAPTALFKLEP